MTLACVLRASGPEFDVDGYLSSTTMKPVRVWRRGETRRLAFSRNEVLSNAEVTLGLTDESDEGVSTHVEKAFQILDETREIELIRRYLGRGTITLDCAICVSARIAMHTESIPAALARRLGELDVELDLTYSTTAEEEEENSSRRPQSDDASSR